MSIQIILPASLVNAERVFKYYIDPDNPETHGWYLYELDEAGSNSYTRNMTASITLEEGDIYLLDDETPNNVLRGGSGSEHILVTSGLESNITIRNHFLATDKILFTQDVAVSKINAIHLLPNVPATPIVQIIFTLENGHSITIHAPAKFTYQIGEEGDELTISELLNPDNGYIEGFIVPPPNMVPEFEYDLYVFSLNENVTSTSAPIGQVTAIDNDEDDSLSYKIINAVDADNNEVAGFFVDDEGNVTYEGDGFDAERFDGSPITLTIEATDNKGASDSANVTIYIKDLIDNAPQFADDTPTSINIEETATGIIGNLTASKDLNSGSILSYALDEETQKQGIFTINASTGALSISEDATLDVDRSNSTHSYEIGIIATERLNGTDSQGLSTTHQLTINITAVDDEAPVIFITSPFMDDNAEQPLILTGEHIRFIDLDTDDHSSISYSLSKLKTGIILAKDGVTLSNDDSFTHSELMDGKISLLINQDFDVASLNDGLVTGFELTSSDGVNTGQPVNFDIDIRTALAVDEPDGSNVIFVSDENASYRISTGAGLDIIADGNGTDIIQAGLGDDIMNLRGDGNRDEVIYNLGSLKQGYIARDGADIIKGFTRGEDVLVFTAEGSIYTPNDLASFLKSASGEDGAPLTDDDQLTVSFSGEVSDDGAQYIVTQFHFNFAQGYVSPDGRVSPSSFTVELAKGIDFLTFADLVSLKDDEGNIISDNIDYGSFSIQDLSVLPSLMTEGSLEFHVYYTDRPMTVDNEVDSHSRQEYHFQETDFKYTDENDDAVDAILFAGPPVGATLYLDDAPMDFSSGEVIVLLSDIGNVTLRLDEAQQLDSGLRDISLDYKVLTNGQPSAETGKLIIFLPIIGTEEVDDITANKRDNIIEGLAGDDRLDGGDGADRLYGYDGDDTLDGGDGDDRLEGGIGDDLFIYHKGDGLDVIFDFGKGNNTIELHGFSDISEIRIATGNGHDIKEGDYGDSAVEDAIIYNTMGTADLSDDLALVVLSDYNADDLTMNESGNYLFIV